MEPEGSWRFSYLLTPQKLELSCNWNDYDNETEPVLSLEQLDAAWRNDRFLKVKWLQIDWGRPSVQDGGEGWLRICRLIQTRMPNVEDLVIESLDNVSDGNLSLLLKHMPKLSDLTMYIFQDGDKPFMFRQLGQVKQLQSLHIIFGSRYSVGLKKDRQMPGRLCFENLADSIEELPLLQDVTISNWCLQDPKECWESVACAFGSRPNLRVDIDRHGTELVLGSPKTSNPNAHTGEHPHTFSRPHTIDQVQWDALQNGPTCDQVLRQTMRKNKLSLPDNYQYNGNKQLWVDAMVAVKNLDRWDCFHTLFSQMPPDEYCKSEYWGTCRDNERIPWIHNSTDKKNNGYSDEVAQFQFRHQCRAKEQHPQPRSQHQRFTRLHLASALACGAFGACCMLVSPF